MKPTLKAFLALSISHGAGKLALAVLPFALAVLCPSMAAADASLLPWEQSSPLSEIARQATIEGVLSQRSPEPAGARASEGGLVFTNPDIKAALWGPSDQLTISLIKTDVFDRRYGTAPTVTLAQIREGAYAPANRGFDDMPADRRRPVRGYLLPEGGRYDPYLCWNAYPFPCQKPVGQIILGLDELKGADAALYTQNCADGSVEVREQKGNAQANLNVLLSVKRNVFALRGTLKGINAPWIRLYRHEDQGHRRYMNADGSFIKGAYDYEKDKAWNGPVEPPESGCDGRYFWIRQRLPAEKTFPKGFTYVLVGCTTETNTNLTTLNHQTGLGTPAYAAAGDRLAEGYDWIRKAPGSAATLKFPPASETRTLTGFVTVVTEAEAEDPLAEAKRRLDRAVHDGYETLAAENRQWFADLYDQREQGRVYYQNGDQAVSENIPELFKSWYCTHGGGCKPDMRRYQASASYASVEQDAQPWKSLPCYNELFYTSTMVRNRADSVDMWWKVIEQWLPAARRNAQEMYGLPGMAFVHGYQPPVLPDHFVHTNVGLDLCIDTAAQVLKVLWDQWDYGGDKAFLKEKVYPPLHDLAIFYAAYAETGHDGKLHFVPSMEAEAWGIFPEFSRSRDAISALCMARWTFLCAASAAETLSVDKDLSTHWRALAEKIAPYPTAETPKGTVYNTIAGVKPSWKRGDHPWYIGVYPTTLADEITLDSSKEEKAQMIRTAYSAPARPNAEVLVLLGACPESLANISNATPVPINGVDALRQEVNRYPERLLNSRSGRIYLFPCIPAAAEIAFRRFQARGAFLVSAAKGKEGVREIEIEARLDRECQLINPWPGKRADVFDTRLGKTIPVTVDRTNGECLRFPAWAGHGYKIKQID